MTPDLGDYTIEVLSAYGVSLALLITIVALSVWRSRKVARALAQVEARRKTIK